MARKAGSIPAVPPTATGEMAGLLQALRQSAAAIEVELAKAKADLTAALNAASTSSGTSLAALAARVLICENDITTLTAGLAAANAAILLRADRDQIISIPLYIKYPIISEDRFFLDSPVAFQITKVTAKLAAGTCTMAIQINGVNMNTGTIPVTTSQVSESPTSSNNVAVGADLDIDITAASGTAAELSVMIHGTIVLA